MRWLFRCNIANERTTEDETKVQGIGHAMRCVSLAREVSTTSDEALLSIEGNQDVETYLDDFGIDYVRNRNHLKIADSFDPDVIVVDINHLDPSVIRGFSSRGLVVNLAPRGLPKYYADVSFTSEPIRDVNEPDDAAYDKWYAGPDYSFIHDDFVELRRNLKLDQDFPRDDFAVVHMGGVDQFNRTGIVIDELLTNLNDEFNFKIIAGPLNPNTGELISRCAQLGDHVELVVGPENLASEFLNARFGILGTGITTYEALAIGVPSLNVGLSEFHDQRGALLEEWGLGQYLGNITEINNASATEMIREFIENDEKIKRYRQRGLETVDGQAATRIISTIREELV